MSQIDTLLTDLLRKEGGYVAHPADRGGPTNYGITQAVAREHGYRGAMQDMPRSLAVQIYKADYWTGPHIDLVAAASPALGEELFDTAVNAGPSSGIAMLQRALNVLHGSELKVDGRLSPGGATLTVLAQYLKARPRDGETNLLKLVNCFQGSRYAEIVERNPSQRAFINGWVANRVGIGA